MMDYSSLMWMVILSIIVSYIILSNVMLTFKNGVYNTLVKLYMSLLMGSTMAVIMIVIMIVEMRMVHHLDIFILVISIVISIILIYLIRDQTYIKQKEYSKAMIEHHDMALLMSKAILRKPNQSKAVYELANSIIASQQYEINLMRSWLDDGFPTS